MSERKLFLQPLVDPAMNPWMFVTGTVLLGVVVGSFGDWINQLISPWLTSLLTIVLLSLLLGMFFRWRQNYTLMPTIVRPPQPVYPYRGLIVFVSPGKGSSSAERAIRFHWRGLENEHSDPVLEHCWLITGGPASEREAANLKERLLSVGIPATIFHHSPRPLSPEQVDDPDVIYDEVSRIYDEAAKLGLSEDEIMADYTGGTKSMTAGMILACAVATRKLQFMKPPGYDENGFALPESVPRAVDIRYELKRV